MDDRDAITVASPPAGGYFERDDQGHLRIKGTLRLADATGQPQFTPVQVTLFPVTFEGEQKKLKVGQGTALPARLCDSDGNWTIVFDLDSQAQFQIRACSQSLQPGCTDLMPVQVPAKREQAVPAEPTAVS